MATAVIESADQEDSWFGLIDRMKEGAVVPVIGPELLDVTVKTQDGSTNSGPFYRFVAEGLCAQYRIECPASNSRPGWDLHAAAAAVISEKKENAEKVRRTAARIINTLASNASVSPVLSVLAKIEAFDLFVSLTCDDFLSAALPEAHVATFSPRAATDSAVDIPPPRPGQRSIFRLLGGASSMTGFAIHEEDVLEYLFALQSEASRRLPIALPELRRRDLLFIGCGLPDWIGRSLLRLFSDDRLFTKSKQEFFSERLSDPSLTAFVSGFSPNTMFFDGEPRTFVEELAKRWSDVSPAPGRQKPLETRAQPTPRAGGPTAFISYASENQKAVRRLAELLMTAGFSDIWLDQKKLIAGDEWSRRIDEAIDSCDFFIPILSHEANSRREGVYWEEWDKALERSRRIPDEFIVPVGIDSAPPSNSTYPRIANTKFTAFFSRHLAHAPDGNLSGKGLDEFRERVRRFSEVK
jgi:TIR domain